LTRPSSWETDYGLATTDVEGLTTLGDVEFVYYANDADGGDAYTALAGNAVWESLPFVQNGNVTRLPDGIWMFGGPTSMQAYIDAVTGALTR
jgi:ferric hydroxamate transport system substrate-binding protein